MNNEVASLLIPAQFIESNIESTLYVLWKVQLQKYIMNVRFTSKPMALCLVIVEALYNSTILFTQFFRFRKLGDNKLVFAL